MRGTTGQMEAIPIPLRSIGKPHLHVGDWRENGTTEGNRDPFSSPLSSTEQGKSRSTRTVDE